MFIESGKIPPQKVLDLFCVFLGGRFVLNNEIQKLRNLEYENDKKHQEIDRLHFENQSLKKQLNDIEVHNSNLKLKYENLEIKFNEVNSKYEQIKNKFNLQKNSFNPNVQTVNDKNELNKILEWED